MCKISQKNLVIFRNIIQCFKKAKNVTGSLNIFQKVYKCCRKIVNVSIQNVAKVKKMRLKSL